MPLAPVTVSKNEDFILKSAGFLSDIKCFTFACDLSRANAGMMLLDTV